MRSYEVGIHFGYFLRDQSKGNRLCGIILIMAVPTAVFESPLLRTSAPATHTDIVVAGIVRKKRVATGCRIVDAGAQIFEAVSPFCRVETVITTIRRRDNCADDW